MKIFCSIFLFLSCFYAFSKNKTQPVKTEETTKSVFKQGHSQPSASSFKDCSSSGTKQKRLKNYSFSGVLSFPGNQIESLVDQHFSYIKNAWPKSCPAHCKQINSYKVLSKAYPVKVSKNFCKKEESRESYSMKKRFPFPKWDHKPITQAHKDMWEWIYSVFIYSYYPFAEPAKEFVKHNLKTACPSCSFYFDYTYAYTKDNHLDLQIKASCGDKRTFFSNFKAEFSLINNWKCEKK